MPYTLRILTTLVTIFLLGSQLQGQIQPNARYEGEMLPILKVSTQYLYVVQNGHSRRTYYDDLEILQAESFGSGFVEITSVNANLDPLKNASEKQRTDPDSMRFKYTATLTSDRNLKNCYALLTFISNGSIGTHFEKIGSLRKGKAAKFKIENKSTIDIIGSLHIFSQTAEIKTNQNDNSYLIEDYKKILKSKSTGVSAVALTQSERTYPHVLSDDGNLLATLRDRDTHYSIIVYDLESMKKICDVKMGEHDDTAKSLTWVSDSQIAYVFKNDLWLLDVQSSEYKKIKNDVYSIIGSLKSNPSILTVLRAGGWRLWTAQFDIKRNKVIGHEDMGYGRTIFDDNGIARIRRRTIDDKETWFIKPLPDSAWVKLDNHVKDKALRFSGKGSDLLNIDNQIHSLSSDGDTLYISTRTNRDTFSLAAFSMSEGVITKTIAALKNYDLSSGGDGDSNFLFTKDTSQPLGIVYETKKTKVKWFDPEFTKIQKMMDATFPENVNQPIDWSQNKKTFIYYSFSDKHPGIYYVFRPQESKLIPLLDLGKYLKDAKLGSCKPISFESRDGAIINGYVTFPPGYKGKEKLPLVVNVHGGPTVRDSWGFSSFNQFLATRGYAVLEVNYRGSTGFGKKYMEKGLYSRLDTVIIDDIADGVNYTIEKEWVDSERVAITGASFGGWATYISLIRYPEIYKAGVAVAAVSNFKGMLRHDRWKFRTTFAYDFWKKLLNEKNFKETEKYIDPYVRAEEINRPLYIMHGERDRRVSVEQAEMMAKKLKKYHKDFRIMIFEHASHSSWPRSSRITRYNETESFIRKYLELE